MLGMKKKDKPPVVNTEVQDAVFEQPSDPKTYDECTTDAQRIDFLNGVIGSQMGEISELKRVKLHFEQDAMYSMYFANNRKANQFAEMINNLDISKPAELDTYVKLTTKQPAIMEILNKTRKEYLKLDEEELTKIEEKGIPLIEQQGKKQK